MLGEEEESEEKAVAFYRTPGPVKAMKWPLICIARTISSVSSIEEAFIHPDVQRILSSIASSSTKSKPEVVFAPQKVKRSRSKLLLMTEEEYKKNLKQSLDSAQSMMQPFPVKLPRTENPIPGTVLHADSEIAGLSPHRHVFVDLSPVSAGQRNLVVVREPQGDLRTATLEERSRFTNIFMPHKQPGRSIKTPALFKDDDQHLRLLLDQSLYMYILKRACIQFDPDDNEFIKITSQVFDHLSLNRRFESLDATPFFSNLVFYCAFSLGSSSSAITGPQRLCNLLVYLLSQDRLIDVARVLRLCSIVNPKSVPKKLSEFPETEAIDSALLTILPTLKDLFTAEQLSELNLSLQSAVDRFKAANRDNMKVAESHCT